MIFGGLEMRLNFVGGVVWVQEEIKSSAVYRTKEPQSTGAMSTIEYCNTLVRSGVLIQEHR